MQIISVLLLNYDNLGKSISPSVKKLFSFVIFFLAVSNTCVGQDTDYQLWANYALTVQLNDKWSYGGDTGMRGVISDYEWRQFLIRPNVNYRINYNLSVSPAIAWFATIDNEYGNVNELRIQEDFNAKWPDLGIVEFSYRVRLEQRFFFYEQNISNEIDVRLRGLIGVETRDFTWLGSKRPIYFQSMVEGFKTLDENDGNEVFINYARLYLVFGQRLSEKLRYELHYIAQGSQLLQENGLQVAQNIFRLRVFHTIFKNRPAEYDEL